MRDSKWEHLGAGHEQPDFILVRESLGIELAEWLDEDQTKKAREFDRFEKEINEAAASSLMTFAKSFQPSTEQRYMTLLELKALPRRNEKNVVIGHLLDFLGGARRPQTSWEQRFGVIHVELPSELARVFRSIHFSCAPFESLNLGFTINRASSFDPEDAVQALLEELNDKLVAKRNLYYEAKAAKRISRLWLLVHYSRGLLWNTPYDGIGLKQGRSLDEHTSRQIIVERCHRFISGIGTGAFDRVFLFFDVSPGSQSLELWPG
ncbi:MAG TPA: hypothetical protein VN742_06810 [Candidatus Binataceae bacterium]|nr:hypothetical protein [Candidatus Binataceae bacterium]